MEKGEDQGGSEAVPLPYLPSVTSQPAGDVCANISRGHEGATKTRRKSDSDALMVTENPLPLRRTTLKFSTELNHEDHRKEHSQQEGIYERVKANMLVDPYISSESKSTQTLVHEAEEGHSSFHLKGDGDPSSPREISDKGSVKPPLFPPPTAWSGLLRISREDMSSRPFSSLSSSSQPHLPPRYPNSERILSERRVADSKTSPTAVSRRRLSFLEDMAEVSTHVDIESVPPIASAVRPPPEPLFPSVNTADDEFQKPRKRERANSSEAKGIDRLLGSVPAAMWQPNSVALQDRKKAHAYWLLLLLGYVAYIALVIFNASSSRKNPPIEINLVKESYQLPDVGFCFEGNSYGSRFACFDDEDGKACANSFEGSALVYGYNATDETPSESLDYMEDHMVLYPESFSDTCQGFRLSTLKANVDAKAWNFHMLVVWNSSYNATRDTGAYESIRMYLYRDPTTPDVISTTPVTLYAPIAFDAIEVPFVRGFLNYEEHVNLKKRVDRRYSAVDMLNSRWRNAKPATNLLKEHHTDTLASIQLDIRALSYYIFSEVDPVDILGALGEISGFWLIVPLLFGLLFYRLPASGESLKMRSLGSWRCRRNDDGQSGFR